MPDTVQNVFDQLLPRKLDAPVEASAFAPSNIALSKYWGKRDKPLNLPLNSSLSVSLGDWGTTTSLSPADQDSLIFNGNAIAATDPFATRLFAFVNYFRRNQSLPLRIESHNTIPTAAGLASSASGFAALTLALNKAFQTQLTNTELSIIARIGSGSASRSLWHGFVRWDQGDSSDGMDSYARPLPTNWSSFRIAIVTVDSSKKSQSSRDGMNHTVATSPLFSAWPAQAERDCNCIESALLEQDFLTVGQTAESNALGMHATMIAARPSLSYLKPETWLVLETLWQARRDGLNAFATMDAGANVKLIYLDKDEGLVRELFPSATCIQPFAQPQV